MAGVAARDRPRCRRSDRRSSRAHAWRTRARQSRGRPRRRRGISSVMDVRRRCATGLPARSQCAKAGQRLTRPEISPTRATRTFLASAAAIGGPAVRRRAPGPSARPSASRSNSTARWTRFEHQSRGHPPSRSAHEGPQSVQSVSGVVFAVCTVKRTRVPTPILPSAMRCAACSIQPVSMTRARWYAAESARRRPAGSDKRPAQDVKDEPTVSLLEAMRLAEGPATVSHASTRRLHGGRSGTGAPALERARYDRLGWGGCGRRNLPHTAGGLSRHAHRATRRLSARRVTRHGWRGRPLAAGGVRSDAGRLVIEEMDRVLRDAQPSRQPGTTADLTAASIFVVLLGGGWKG